MAEQSSERAKKIAILGSRGIPAEFGGFETFAEQLAVRLVDRGFDVTVFCESTQSYREPTYKGVKLVYLSTPNIVGLRSVWFDIVSILRTLRGYDVVYMLGYHAAFAFVLPWLFRTNFWTNMDGLEWKRDKWSANAKRYLQLMEWFAARFSRRLVADAEGIAQHLREAYRVGHKTLMIPYGAYEVDGAPDACLIEEYGVEPGEYYLVVCRLEPENHVREIVNGFVASSSPRKLIVVGDHEADTGYIKTLLDNANERVSFVGTIFDPPRLIALRWYCRAYFHGHSVGGTNPSLLEAMACRNHTIAHDNVFNR
jgi:glycosyltransferase involved in cell wall biosynthesis